MPIHSSIFMFFSVEQNSKLFLVNVSLCRYFHTAYFKYSKEKMQLEKMKQLEANVLEMQLAGFCKATNPEAQFVILADWLYPQ